MKEHRVDFEVGTEYKQMKGKGKNILLNKQTQYRDSKCAIKIIKYTNAQKSLQFV